MTHFFEKTIVDAKDIYTEYLINVIQPLIYEGFHSIYEKAVALEKTYTDASKIDPNVKSPGILILFQHFLLGVDKLNDGLVDDESKRMRDNSRCADIFDDLIKAVVKSHIIVLTYTASRKKCKIVNEKLHEKVETKTFVHKCYVECARIFYDHSALFWHEFTNSELKENQRIIYQLIKVGIKNAIKRSLPMKSILEEYLKNDYVDENDENLEDNYMKAKDLIKRDLYGGDNDDNGGGIMKIMDSESSIDNNMLRLERDVDDISALVYGRKILDTLDGTVNSPKQKDMVELSPVPLPVPPQVTQVDAIVVTAPIVLPAPVADVIKSDKMENFFKGGNKRVAKTNVLLDAIAAARVESKKDETKNEINIVKKKTNINDADNYFDEMLNN